jgi:hypothetical protein
LVYSTISGRCLGKTHDHLGMAVDYAEDGKVKDFIDDCIQKCIERVNQSQQPELDLACSILLSRIKM